MFFFVRFFAQHSRWKKLIFRKSQSYICIVRYLSAIVAFFFRRPRFTNFPLNTKDSRIQNKMKKNLFFCFGFRFAHGKQIFSFRLQYFVNIYIACMRIYNWFGVKYEFSFAQQATRVRNRQINVFYGVAVCLSVMRGK